MSFGVAKCGVMRFTTTPDTSPPPPVIHLHGQQVPIVDSYSYLGCDIDDKLTLKPWTLSKRSAIRKAIRSLHPLITNKSLPLRFRLRVFSSLALGTASYGLEAIGGSVSSVQPMQSVINDDSSPNPVI
eukprot:jgi/Hompol1/3741/HPOL_006767-RA